MTTETRDPQFASFVNELSDSLTNVDFSFAVSSLEIVTASIVALYEAFATPEPGRVAQAFKGLAL